MWKKFWTSVTKKIATIVQQLTLITVTTLMGLGSWWGGRTNPPPPPDPISIVAELTEESNGSESSESSLDILRQELAVSSVVEEEAGLGVMPHGTFDELTDSDTEEHHDGVDTWKSSGSRPVLDILGDLQNEIDVKTD